MKKIFAVMGALALLLGLVMSGGLAAEAKAPAVRDKRVDSAAQEAPAQTAPPLCAQMPLPLHSMQPAAPQPGEPQPAGEPQPRPVSACIEIQAVAQMPQLPNGCEITSLTTVLNHRGFDVDKEEMARDWLPRADGFYGANPEVEYMGYPDWSGWYCYQQPIIAAANGYLEAAGSPLRAQDKTGATREDLKDLLAAGTPVVFWSTVDLAWPRYSQSYAWALDGQTFIPYVNVHCMVLKGYDDEWDVFFVADPLYYYSEIGQDWFMTLFDAMGARAVVVEPGV